MQNLLTISLAEFKTKLPAIKSKDLYKLFQGCRQLLRNQGDKLPMELIHDLQRKMTNIERVLINRRAHLNKDGKINPEYFKNMWVDLRRTHD